MAKKLAIKALMSNGTSFEGTTEFGSLSAADHSQFLTVDRPDGTTLSINLNKVDALEVNANREELDAARDEFQAQIRAEQDALTKAAIAATGEGKISEAEAGNA